MDAFYEQLHRHTKIAQASIFLVLACPCLSLLVHAALHLRAGVCWVLPKGGRGLGFAPIRGLGMGLGRWLGCGFGRGVGWGIHLHGGGLRGSLGPWSDDELLPNSKDLRLGGGVFLGAVGLGGATAGGLGFSAGAAFAGEALRGLAGVGGFIPQLDSRMSSSEHPSHPNSPRAAQQGVLAAHVSVRRPRR